jgi:threonine dehydrogenase-like Zn-dependent dehydrogenase
MVNAVSALPDDCTSVVVQGAGLLGLYACALLRETGVEHVFCVENDAKRIERIPWFGAVPVDGRPEHYPKRRETITGIAKHGVDAVLEVAGVAHLVPEGIRLLRPGGYYGLVGAVHPQSLMDVTAEQIIRKCLTIYGVHNYSPRHLDRAVEFLKQTADKYPYEALVSPPFSLADLPRAIEVAESRDWCRVSVSAL